MLLRAASDVINLHGDIATVVCLDCGDRSRLGPNCRIGWPTANPQLDEPPVLEHAELRPDGDAVARDWQQFHLVGCLQCGGRLKPDVVFFGESVPKARVEAAYALVERADVLVVLGSSLTVMSGLRFVRHQARLRATGGDHQSRPDPGRRPRHGEDR